MSTAVHGEKAGWSSGFLALTFPVLDCVGIYRLCFCIIKIKIVNFKIHGKIFFNKRCIFTGKADFMEERQKDLPSTCLLPK